MSSENNEGAKTPLVINAQYIRGLSFESPNPVQSLVSENTQNPEFEYDINVGARKIGDTSYEVSLKVFAKATKGEDTLFDIKLDYGGIITLTDVEEQNVNALLLIEAPRFLFPYARNVIAETTRGAGFSALSLAPVDFLALHRKKSKEQESTELTS